jgi:uncharacterized protein YutE (UPF0331/DUF86 family)
MKLQESERLRILTKLDEMVKYVQELREMLPEEDVYLEDLIRRRACEKTVEAAIESLIDVSAMLVSAQRFGLPTSEENIFDILVEKNVLDEELGEKLKDMIGFRNVLVHRYGRVDDTLVYNTLTAHLGDFEEFESAIRGYLHEQVKQKSSKRKQK